jgi:thiamine-monophosphate kinase
MDVSDGLVKDLDRLLRASGVAGCLYAGDVPLSGPARQALARAPERLAQLITAGDDYEVLAAVPQDKAAAFAAAAAAAGAPVARIGEVLPGPSALAVIGSDGGALALPPRMGWDHF